MNPGEELAKMFIESSDNLPQTDKVMQAFFKLDFKQQCRFLSFLAGYIVKLKGNFELK